MTAKYSPPKEILQEIGNFHGARWYNISGPEPGQAGRLAQYALSAYLDIVLATTNPRSGYGNANYIREITKNASWHGSPKGEEFYAGIIVGEKTFAVASRDSHGYFGKEETKRIYENLKEGIASTVDKHDLKPIGGGMGSQMLATMSKKIFVDTQTETLYAVLGDQYSWKNTPTEEQINASYQNAIHFLREIENANNNGFSVELVHGIDRLV